MGKEGSAIGLGTRSTNIQDGGATQELIGQTDITWMASDFRSNLLGNPIILFMDTFGEDVRPWMQILRVLNSNPIRTQSKIQLIPNQGAEDFASNKHVNLPNFSCPEESSILSLNWVKSLLQSSMFATLAALEPASLIPGENPLTPVQHPKRASQSEYNILHTQESRAHLLSSQQSTSYVHAQVHQHQHTHRHTHQHTFTPMLQHSSILPAPSIMGTQDSNLLQPLSRGTPKQPCFVPITAFHRTSQGAFRLNKGERWGAMHVCIAWKIHHHKQVKKMQMKPKNLHREPAPEFTSATNLIDSMKQHRALVQPSSICPNPECPCGNLEINIADMSGTAKTAENKRHLSKSHSPDQHDTSPAPHHNHTTKREKPDCEEWGQSLHLRWDRQEEKIDEKEKHRGHQLDISHKALPLTSLHQTVTPELDSSHNGSRSWESGDRKRQLECGGLVKVKRVKQEAGEDGQFDSCKSQPPHQTRSKPFPSSETHTTSSDPSSHTMPVQHINTEGGMPALYSIGSRCNVARTYSTTPGGLISFLGTAKYPYSVPSWGPLWDVHKSMDLPSSQDLLIGGYPLNSCEVIRTANAAWWHNDREAYHGLPPPRLHFPLALRQQEDTCLRGSEFLLSLNENYYRHSCQPHHCHSATMGHLHQSGFLATVYPEPHVSRLSLTQESVATSTSFTRLCP